MANVRIDFISDIACPWCAIGLASLSRALADVADEVQVDIRFHPFELNPGMPFTGEDTTTRLLEKYGISTAELASNREAIARRAGALGVVINMGAGARTWNTFDAHRLLHWAQEEHMAAALPLKRALFEAYFDRNDNVADHEVLVALAADCGLDADAARAMLASDRYGNAVRALEQQWQEAGIHSVPATVINGKHLISGGQPPEMFAEALRTLAK